MNNSITLNYLTRLAGSIPKSSKTQQLATESPFRRMTTQDVKAEETAPAGGISQTGDMSLEEYKQSIW